MKMRLLLFAFTTILFTVREVNAADLYNERFGSSGPVVVLVSGMSSSTDVWRGVAEDLAIDHRVHILSIPGMGGIPEEASPVDTIAVLSKALNEYLEKNDMSGVTLVAHSASGVAALTLGQASSPRLSTIIVVDSLPFMATNSGAVSVNCELRERISKESLEMRSESRDSFSSRMRTGVLGGIAHKEKAEGLAYAAGLSNQRLVASMFESVMTTDLRDGIKELRVPTYVIYADQAINGAPKGYMRQRYRLQYSPLDENRLIEVANAGHYLMVDYPSIVSRHIRSIEAQYQK